MDRLWKFTDWRLFEEAGENGADEAATDVVDSSPPIASVAAPVAPVSALHDENAKFVEQWAKGSPVDETTPTPVEKTDAVEKELPDDAASPKADDGQRETVSDTKQDPLLLSLAEAYDYQPEELEGISNAGLKKLLAREQRLRGSVVPQDKTDTTKQPAAAPSSTTTTTTSGVPDQITFEVFAAEMTEQLKDEGLSDEAITRQLKIEKVRWDRDEELRREVLGARQEAAMTRQEMANREMQHLRELEANEVFSEVDRLASSGFEELVGRRGQKQSDSQMKNLERLLKTYDVLRTADADTPPAMLARRAFHAAFAEEVAKAAEKDFSRKVQKQAGKVLGQGVTAKAPETGEHNGNPWDSPAAVRAFNKAKANRT